MHSSDMADSYRISVYCTHETWKVTVESHFVVPATKKRRENVKYGCIFDITVAPHKYKSWSKFNVQTTEILSL
jgi:hypothetical protein